MNDYALGDALGRLLVVTLLTTGIAWIVVRVVKTTPPLTRKQFSLRILGLLIGVLVFIFVTIGSWLSWIAVLAGWILVPYWALGRLADMGETDRRKAVVANVPLIGLIFIVWLMCWKGTPPQPTTAPVAERTAEKGDGDIADLFGEG